MMMNENRSWLKSSLSFSNGNCVEVTDLEWLKSSESHANGSCAEVASGQDGTVFVRNSRHPDGAILAFTRDEWKAFIGGAKLGEFDRFGS